MSFSRSAADPADTLPDLAATLAAPGDDAFVTLGAAFHTRLPAAPLPAPYVVGFSAEVAQLLGLPPSLARTDRRAVRPAIDYATGRPTRRYASVYSGHQFGVWAGQLGDGRALRSASCPAATAGATSCSSRRGRRLFAHGRRPPLRSSANTCARRRCSASASHHARAVGDRLASRSCARDRDVGRRHARVPSFIRFGHFEHFASNDRPDLLRRLADHVIDRFYPACRDADDPTSRCSKPRCCARPT
jgi:uncharacterized protein YdiU (UPF0061 family)